MAYRVGNRNILQKQKRQALGIRLPFSGDAVFTSTYQTLDMYKSNLLNYFLTVKGERYLNPTFGTTIRNYLFEPLTDNVKNALYSEIQNDMKVFFPAVRLRLLEINQDINTQTLQVYIRYEIFNTLTEDSLVVNFV